MDPIDLLPHKILVYIFKLFSPQDLKAAVLDVGGGGPQHLDLGSEHH